MNGVLPMVSGVWSLAVVPSEWGLAGGSASLGVGFDGLHAAHHSH